MNNKDKEMLEVYRSVSAYTSKALEESIANLKRGVSRGSHKSETVEILKDRLETLEEYLIKIELDF